MDKLVKTLCVDSLSKSQVSRMAAELDEHVGQCRHRPLDTAGPFTFVVADALTMRVREGGRVINAVVLIATGVSTPSLTLNPRSELMTCPHSPPDQPAAGAQRHTTTRDLTLFELGAAAPKSVVSRQP